MAGYNQLCLGIFIIVSFGIIIIIIFIIRWFINYSQDQIVILRGVLDEVYEIISEISGDEGVVIIIILPNWRLADGHASPISYFFHLRLVVSIV